ncbi:MAG TPA: chorismate mutase [Acidothermaceae bacterium]|jgi:chorismate mutase
MNQTVGDPIAQPEATGDDPAADVNAAVARLRGEIDEIDMELIGIVQRRIAVSKQIQAVRMSHGGPRRQHSRELKIVNAYVEGLGRGGSQLALTVLELCRGRA